MQVDAEQPAALESWQFMQLFRSAIATSLREVPAVLLQTDQARLTLCTQYLPAYLPQGYMGGVPTVEAGQEFELRLLSPEDRGYNPESPDATLALLDGVPFALVSRAYGEFQHSTEILVARLARLAEAGHPLRLRGVALQQMAPFFVGGFQPPPRMRFHLSVIGPRGRNNEHLFAVGRACMAAGFALPVGLVPDVRMMTLAELQAAEAQEAA